jgi:hypothetical protein
MDESWWEPLDRFIGQLVELGRFLRLAINLAGGLSKLHHRGLIQVISWTWKRPRKYTEKEKLEVKRTQKRIIEHRRLA